MKVKRIIEILKKFDPDLDVCLTDSNSVSYVWPIYGERIELLTIEKGKKKQQVVAIDQALCEGDSGQYEIVEP